MPGDGIIEDWEIEEAKRVMTLKLAIPMVACIIGAVIGIGVSIYLGEINYIGIGVVTVMILASFVLAFLLFSARTKYDRMMGLRRR